MRSPGSVPVGADVIRRYWPLWTVATAALAAGIIFAIVITSLIATVSHRAALADQRNERERTAMCAVLSTIPGSVPPEIAAARIVYAPTRHPKACQYVPGAHPTPSPMVVRVLVNGQPAVIVVNPPSPRPSPSRTATPRPRPRPTPSHSPSPHPSHTPTPCIIPGVPPGCGH